MPTKINTTVRRQTVGEYNGSGKGLRPIVIEIRKGDLLALRYSKMKQEYVADISAVMTWLQGRTAGVSIEPRKKKGNL